MKPLSMALTIGFASFACTQCADQETRSSTARTPALRQPAFAGADEAPMPTSGPRSLFADRLGQAGMPDADVLAAATLANSVAHPWYDWTAAPITFVSESAEVAYWQNVGVSPGGPTAPVPGVAAPEARQSGATMPGGPAAAAPPSMAAPRATAMAVPGVELNPLDTWLTEADERLVQRTRAALQANLLTALPGRSIQLAARDGVITISGDVRFRREELNIVDVVRAVAGEGMVRDELSAPGARRGRWR